MAVGYVRLGEFFVMDKTIINERAKLYQEILDELIRKNGEDFSRLFSELISIGMDTETAIFKCYNDLIVKQKNK